MINNNKDNEINVLYVMLFIYNIIRGSLSSILVIHTPPPLLPHFRSKARLFSSRMRGNKKSSNKYSVFLYDASANSHIVVKHTRCVDRFASACFGDLLWISLKTLFQRCRENCNKFEKEYAHCTQKLGETQTARNKCQRPNRIIG